MSFRLFQSLLSRASKVQARIEDEQMRKSPNQLRLLKLKSLRLLISERLHQLTDLSIGNAGALRPVPVRVRKQYR